MKNRRNYYRILQVQPDAPAEIIRTSYRTLMHKLKMHPDLGGKSLVNDAVALMERVNYIRKELNDSAIAEEFIDGREFYVGVLGNAQAKALPPVEGDFTGFPEGVPKVLDSKAKWDERSKEYKGTKSVLASLPDGRMATPSWKRKTAQESEERRRPFGVRQPAPRFW